VKLTSPCTLPEKHVSRMVLAFCLIAVLLIAAACGDTTTTPPSMPTSSTTVPTGPTVDPALPVALVNGQPITMDAFQRELARYQAGNVALGLQVADENALKQQVLDKLIEDSLIRQKAAAEGITVTDAEVDQVINDMIAETGQEYFDGWLITSSYSLPEFREEIRLQLTTNKLTETVVASVPTTTEQVHARHILVNDQAQAQEVLDRLSGGEDFAALAAQYSVDRSTQNNGGDLGWFPRGGLLVPEIEEAAFSMQPNQISGIVQSAWGFAIVQTLEFDPGREIDPDTRQRLINQAIDTWRLALRDGATIEQLIPLTS
jgi:parvulin-like peptidyl-prolyl isomerase